MINKKIQTPKEFIFIITNRCPLRCNHCFYWHSLTSGAGELDLEQIKAIISPFQYPLNMVILTGGEPFVRNDLAEICNSFSELNKTKNIQILTNGYFPETICDTVKKILKTSKVRLAIQVSLDGLKETHNLMRNDKDSFDRAVQTIQGLKTFENQLNFELRVATAICQKNLHELESLALFVRRNLKISQHIFEITRDISFTGKISRDHKEQEFGPRDKGLLLSLEHLRMLKPSIRRIYFVKPLGSIKNILKRVFCANILRHSVDSIIKKKRGLPCRAGHDIGVIYPNGDVAFCEMTKPVGNLRETNFDFKKIWSSEDAEKRRFQTKDCYCGHTCYLFSYFRLRRKFVSLLNLMLGSAYSAIESHLIPTPRSLINR